MGPVYWTTSAVDRDFLNGEKKKPSSPYNGNSNEVGAGCSDSLKPVWSLGADLPSSSRSGTLRQGTVKGRSNRGLKQK